MRLDTMVERIYRLERLVGDLARDLDAVSVQTRRLAQQFREVESELSLLARGGGSGDPSEPTKIRIKLINQYGVPINAAKLSISVAAWVIGSGVPATYGGGNEDVSGYDPDYSDDYAVHTRETSTSGADGIVEYDLTNFTGPPEPGASSASLRELFGVLKRPTLSTSDYYGNLLSCITPGYAYDGDGNIYHPYNINGPTIDDPDNPGTPTTHAIVPGSLCTLTISPFFADPWLSFSFASDPIPSRRFLCTDQHESGFIQYSGRPRSPWTATFSLTSTSDGLGGYKLRVQTTRYGYPPTNETFNSATRGLVGGKARLTFDTSGSVAASRIYPSGSTVVTLDEL